MRMFGILMNMAQIFNQRLRPRRISGPYRLRISLTIFLLRKQFMKDKAELQIPGRPCINDQHVTARTGTNG